MKASNKIKSSFKIGRSTLNAGACYIIAEIGSNHDRKIKRAFQMIEKAAQAGANAVKFQLFKADSIAANIDLPETRLNDQFAKFGKTVYDLYKDMELPDSWLEELKACCHENGIDFLATPFDEASADRLAKLGVPAMKVASFEITHIPLLKHLGRLKIPVLLSTGMANIKEIREAVDAVSGQGESRIALFHCGIDYPAPYESVHLNCMETLRQEFACPVGYSDHTVGLAVPAAACALGAALFEKHVSMKGGKSPDHDFALDIDALADMVKMMRQCEQSLGGNRKEVRSSELRYLRRGRRSVFVVRDVLQGEKFTAENLAVLRPGTGVHPREYEKICGKMCARTIKAPYLLKKGDWR